jgi:serine/threonine-protein kinase
MARENLSRNRGDRRGAFHLAVFMFAGLVALWACRMHASPYYDSLLAYVLLELLIASAFAVVTWTIYLAAEPFVRRYWPRTLVAWTRILSGRFHDGIVGRDILIGAAVSCAWRILFDIQRIVVPNQTPNTPSPTLLTSSRSALSELLENVPKAVEFTLVMFFAIFLLRMLLRREWLAGVVLTLLFVLAAAAAGNGPADLAFTAIIYGSFALVTIRYGLLSLASLILIDGVLADIPASFDSSAWYYSTFAVTLAGVAALVIWAFRQSLRRERSV